jgi:hypothetical protein
MEIHRDLTGATIGSREIGLRRMLRAGPGTDAITNGSRRPTSIVIVSDSRLNSD